MNVLITGSTGMIGKGVLLECLKNEAIQKVWLLNRNTIGMDHAKIEEVLHPDFNDLNSIKNRFSKIDACFHCMGVSSIGMSEEQYSGLTYDVTRDIADICFGLNPQMTFIYVSGTGTDSTEKGRQMWARVKGRTENYVLNKGFGKALMFRPGAILPENGIRSKTKWYQLIYDIMRPFYPLLKKSKNITTTTKIGRAMINALQANVPGQHLENRDINYLASEPLQTLEKH